MTLEEATRWASGKARDEQYSSERPASSKENPATADRPNVKAFLAKHAQFEEKTWVVRHALVKAAGTKMPSYETDWHDRSFADSWKKLAKNN